jgi:2-O-methyltransferase
VPSAKKPTLLRHLKKTAKSVLYRLQGIPPIATSAISQELIQACVAKDAPTLLEIGCNDGTQTLWMAEMFPQPKISCFEPDPRAIARFKSKIGLRPNVTLYEMALSDRVGEITFHQSDGKPDGDLANEMPAGWDQSGSIRPPKNHLVKAPWVTFEHTITVPTMTLDSWCEQHGVGPIDFIWMDVQGAEIDVLSGAKRALSQTRFLYTEYSNRELYEGQANMKRLLEYLGDFAVLVRYHGDLLLRNKRLVGDLDPAIGRLVAEAYR